MTVSFNKKDRVCCGAKTYIIFMKCILLTFICLNLISCATGNKFTDFVKPDKDVSVLYIYRPGELINGGMAPYVYINNKRYSKLYNGGYQMYILKPGIYKIFVDGNFFEWSVKVEDVTVELSPQSISYIRLVSGASILNLARYAHNPEGQLPDMILNGGYLTLTDARLEIVSKNIAKKEIINTHLSMRK